MTYAEFLATMTVKSLNAIAKDMGLKGYSKLRKAELVAVIDNAIAEIFPVILSVEVPADVPAIRKIIAPVKFSAADAMRKIASAPRQIASKPIVAATLTEVADETTEELCEAYTRMRATFRTARGATQVKIGTRLRSLAAMLRSRGVDLRTV